MDAEGLTWAVHKAGEVIAPAMDDDPENGQLWREYSGDYYRVWRVRWDDGKVEDRDELELDPE